MSGLLASIFRSHWIVKSHSILEFSLSTTLSGFMFIPVISSFQSTFTTKLPMYIPRHVIVPSFIFCLRQLTALTHHMGHRFSLTSAHSAQRGFCCVINVKPHLIRSQSLFLGATYQGLSTSFQISFAIYCQVLSQSTPSKYYYYYHSIMLFDLFRFY